MSPEIILGGFATFLALVAEIIDIRAIFVPDPCTGERARPSRVTYWIWTAVQGLLAAGYIATGEVSAAGISAIYALCFLLIAILSVRYGYGAWEKTDTYSLIGVFAAIPLWMVSESLIAVMALMLLVDFLGAYWMVKKTWEAPWTTSRMAWTLAALASLMNFGAVKEWGFEDVGYNVYFLMVAVLVALPTWTHWYSLRRK